MPYFAYKKSGAAANTGSSAPDHDVYCCGNGGNIAKFVVPLVECLGEFAHLESSGLSIADEHY